MKKLLSFIIFALLVTTFSCSKRSFKNSSIVFDAFMDLDDLYSLYLIAKNNEIDLLGVTVSGTDVFYYQNAAKNAENVLYLANATDIPLSKKLTPAFCSGRKSPKGSEQYDKILEQYNLPKSPVPALDISGEQLIHKIALSSKNKFTVVAVGPLTNIAHAITEHPSVKEKIERIIFLGGSLHTTESITVPLKSYWKFASKYALAIDPCAANIILTSGIPVTVIPLDVTNLVPLNKFVIEKYAKPPQTPGAEFVMEVLNASLRHETPGTRTPFWDMIAIMSVIDPSMIKTTKMPLKVITEEGKNFGHLVTGNDGRIAEVCTYINTDKFYKKLFDMVNRG